MAEMGTDDFAEAITCTGEVVPVATGLAIVTLAADRKNSPISLAVCAAPGHADKPSATQVVFRTLSWLCKTADRKPRFTLGPTSTVSTRPPHPLATVALQRLSTVLPMSPSSKVMIMMPSPPG